MRSENIRLFNISSSLTDNYKIKLVQLVVSFVNDPFCLFN